MDRRAHPHHGPRELQRPGLSAGRAPGSQGPPGRVAARASLCAGRVPGGGALADEELGTTAAALASPQFREEGALFIAWPGEAEADLHLPAGVQIWRPRPLRPEEQRPLGRARRARAIGGGPDAALSAGPGLARNAEAAVGRIRGGGARALAEGLLRRLRVGIRRSGGQGRAPVVVAWRLARYLERAVRGGLRGAFPALWRDCSRTAAGRSDAYESDLGPIRTSRRGPPASGFHLGSAPAGLRATARPGGGGERRVAPSAAARGIAGGGAGTGARRGASRIP